MSKHPQEIAMDCPSSPSATCPHCNKLFPNDAAMVEHMELEYRRSKWQAHIHCQICKKYFKSHDALDAHSKRNHPKDQKLDCPACSKHFVRATDMVRHIEQNQCPRIDTKKLNAVREQKLWFARELQARHQGDYNKEAEAAYMSRNAALRPKAEATVRPYPLQFEVFESENVDVYSYYQNVLQASQIAQSSTAAQVTEASRIIESSTAVQVTEASRIIESSTAVQATKASPQKPQLPAHDSSQPISIEKWQQDIPKAAVSLLEDFDPSEADDLQPSLIDYYDAGDTQRGPWSVFFNPWENDDLIGMSTRAPSRAPSPIHSRVSTPRAQSPVATIIESSSEATVIEGTDAMPTRITQAAQPAKTPASVMNAETSQVPMPARSFGGRATPPYNPYTLMPLRNYKALATTKASGSADSSTQNTSAPTPPTTSQALTPTKASGANLSPIQKFSLPESAKMSQALTPTKGPGGVAPAPAPAQSMEGTPMADFDTVKKSFADFAALHNPENPNFRVESYWNKFVGKYKCPMPQCFKSFKRPGQLEHHLGTHMQEKKCMYPCPGCKDMFETIAALIAHTESQSIRCRFRHSKNYGIFLSQALAGIVDVVGEDMEHGTVEFAVSKEAKRNFGVVTPPKETRHSRSDEFKAATAALEQRAVDEQEEQRKFWEEHERQIEAQKAKEREQERVMQAKKEQEKKMKEETAKKEARTRQVTFEHQGKFTEPNARGADQERIRQAKMSQERKIKEESAERKAPEQQWVHVKEETSVIMEDDDMKKLEEEERQLVAKMEKLQEQRWKLQQEQEKRAMEAAQKEVQARQAADAGQQRKEEQSYTVNNPNNFNWW